MEWRVVWLLDNSIAAGAESLDYPIDSTVDLMANIQQNREIMVSPIYRLNNCL